MKTTTTGVRMPLEMRKRIEDEAAKLNTTLTDCCRGLINDGFEHRYHCKKCDNPKNPGSTEALKQATALITKKDQEIAALKSKLKERDNTRDNTYANKHVKAISSANPALSSTGFDNGEPRQSDGLLYVGIGILGLLIAPNVINWLKTMMLPRV